MANAGPVVEDKQMSRKDQAWHLIIWHAVRNSSVRLFYMVTGYCHKQVISILTALVTALFFLSPAFSDARQTEATDEAIRYLLEYVARSDLTFLRNSGRYSAQEASEHMQKKFEHFRDKIETPEEFIELCATRSLLSGKPYQVIIEHGQIVNTGEWLTTRLKEYRDSATTGVH